MNLERQACGRGSNKRTTELKTITLLVSFLVTFAAAGATLAQKKSIDLPNDNSMAQLKAGSGRDAVKNKCAICHSTDYIVRQPGSDAKRWEGEVKKMITVYGASINDADAKAIVDYLTAAYGPAQANTGKPAPAESGAPKTKASATRRP